MPWIRCKSASRGDPPIYVNSDLIFKVVAVAGGAVLHVVHRGEAVNVTDTPDEVMKLIEDASKHA